MIGYVDFVTEGRQDAFNELVRFHLDLLALGRAFQPWRSPRIMPSTETSRVLGYAWGSFDVAKLYTDQNDGVSAYTASMAHFAQCWDLDPSALNEEWPDEP